MGGMFSRSQDAIRALARWYLFEVAAVVFAVQALRGSGFERVSGISLALACAGLAVFQKTSTSSGWRRVIRVVFLMVGLPLVLGGLLVGAFALMLGWRGFTQPEAGAAVLAAMVLLPGSMIPIVGGGLLIRMGLKSDQITVTKDLFQIIPGRFPIGGEARSRERVPGP